MRVFAWVCAIFAATLAALASLWMIQVVYEQTDREALYGVLLLICLATPFALVAASLSLLNRQKWTKALVLSSCGTLVCLGLVAAWWKVLV